MRAIEDGRILFRNTMRITSGHLDGFQQAIRDAVWFVEEHGPQLMVDVFIDEQNMLVCSFQLYRDSESVLQHWQLSDPYIRAVMEHCTVERLDVYGQPTKAVEDGIRGSSGPGVSVTVTRRFHGLTTATWVRLTGICLSSVPTLNRPGSEMGRYAGAAVALRTLGHSTV